MRIEWNESFYRATLLSGAVKSLLDEQAKRTEQALARAGIDGVRTDYYHGDRRNAIDIRGEILPKEAFSARTVRVFNGL